MKVPFTLKLLTKKMKSMKQILSKLMSFIKDIHVYTTLSLILCIKYQKCIRYKTIAVLLKYFFLTWPFLNLLMLHCLICHVKVNDVTLTFIELKVKAMAHFRLCTKTTQALCVASIFWHAYDFGSSSCQITGILHCNLVLTLKPRSNLFIYMLQMSMVQYCTWVLDKHSAKYGV